MRSRQNPNFLPLILALVAGSSAALDTASLTQIEAVEATRVPLPAAGVRGLLWRDGALLLLYGAGEGLSAPDSSYIGRLVRFDPESGQSETVRSEKNGFEAGLARGTEFLWSAGSLVGEAPQLYRLDPRNGAVLDAFPLPGQHPGGIAFDGSYLWVSDADARKLFRMDVEEGKVSRKLRAPGFYPTGLCYDGNSFWCADAASGRIYRMRGNNGRVDGVIARDAFERRGSFVSLTWDGRALWWVAADDAYAVRLELLR